MTPTELAEYLDIDIKEVYTLWIDDPLSELPFINVKGEIRFSKTAVDEYLSSGVKIFN